ncbi:MAG TPA: DUF6351 family protein [Streptosporangiaceae bacterium]|nr:DUF6351 family protein [Streptosporangiaceae bacterium]
MNAALRAGAAIVVGAGLAGIVAADQQVRRAAGLDGPARPELTVVSGRPDQVTGGDARIVVTIPRGVRADQVRLTRADEPDTADEPDAPDAPDRADGADGVDLTGLLRPYAARDGGGRRELTAVVTGLRRGRTTLIATAAGRRAALTLDDHGAGPVFSGPRRYPFVCKTDRNGLGQPIADNNDHQGMRVFAERDGTRTLQIAGWSRDCAAHTKIDYLYRSTDGTFHPLRDPRRRPADIVETTTLDGHTVPYLVRRERGVVNRFVYSIAMLAPPASADPRDVRRWNGRLLYRFGGGIGVGHDQGVLADADSLYDPGLSRGYAVAASTGTQTGVQLDLRLSAETALMVKEHFVEAYGVPRYTVGVGGSGGGMQQYVDAEHHPGLLDAAIPQFAFPDAVTRLTGIGDCEPLERYFDAGRDPLWRTWANRSLVEGLRAGTTAKAPQGGSVCANGWRGLTQRLFNPRYPPEQPEWAFMDPPGAMAAVRWSYWEDVPPGGGRDAAGFAGRTWDNVGVQYGLRAVREGRLAPARFLDLNAAVGGWRRPGDMRPEGCPYVPPGCARDPDPWSARNLTGTAGTTGTGTGTGTGTAVGGARPAPRTAASPAAIRAAYASGQVFTGRAAIPIIDWRPYLDEALDIHDAVESFITRRRIIDARGDAGNQAIWFTDARPYMAFDETGRALEVMDEWLARIRARPDRSVAVNRPREAADHCTDAQGRTIAAGPRVWDGIIDDHVPGECTRRFRPHATPRIAAGGPYSDDVFACRLRPVTRAVAAGDYGVWRPNAAQVRRLERIFPTGVCWYPKSGR